MAGTAWPSPLLNLLRSPPDPITDPLGGCFKPIPTRSATAPDVTDTLNLALQPGLDQIAVVHRPRLLSDNGASYVSGELAEWLNRESIGTSGVPRTTL